MRNHVDGYYVSEVPRLTAADHESNYFVRIGGDQRTARARSQIELKLEPRIRDVFIEGGVIDFVEPFEVGRFILANLHCGFCERFASAGPWLTLRANSEKHEKLL
jgi:hypothetical protein